MTKKPDTKPEDNPHLLREMQITRYRDILIFLPVLAAIFFLTPALDLLPAHRSVFGIPLNFLAIFFGWSVLIVLIRNTNKAMQKKLRERRL